MYLFTGDWKKSSNHWRLTHVLGGYLLARNYMMQVSCLDKYNIISTGILCRDGHGLGSMAIHLAHHCFSFNNS